MVAMLHMAFEHIGHGFEAAVGVGRKACDVVRGVVRAKLIEHEEGVEAAKIAAPEDALELYASAVASRLAG
jgi:hypothetical protein